MKYLLLLATVGLANIEAPDPGPYDSLEACQQAGILWSAKHPDINDGQGVILTCRPQK